MWSGANCGDAYDLSKFLQALEPSLDRGGLVKVSRGKCVDVIGMQSVERVVLGRLPTVHRVATNDLISSF